ncbi:N-acetylglutamate synthase [compost metagenome]
MGGVTGDVAWNILNVHLLAVDPACRGTGLGASLLAEIENRARQLGCKVSELTTMSWQAPHFYQKQGYEIFGEIKDCPNEGHTKYYLKKRL